MSTPPQPVTCNDCSEKQGTTLSIRTLAKTFALNTYALRCTGHLQKTAGEVSVFRFSARIRPEPQSTTTESWEHRCMEHFRSSSEQHRSRLQPTGPAWNFPVLKRKARSTQSIAAPAKPLGPNTYAHRLAEHFKKRSGTNPAPLPTHRTSQKPFMTATKS